MENYEKKYKKALEKLQEALAPGEDGCKISGLTRDCLTNIFPELTEDEDENTRKELLAFIKNWKNPSNIGRPSDFPMFTKNKEQCDKYIAWLEKQDNKKQIEHLELKAGHWYICHRPYCCRADSLTVKEGERFKCEKDGVVKGFVIKEPEKYFKELSVLPHSEDAQNEARRRSTIQVLEYAKSLDAYNQYGKEDIDKNITWLEKQGEKKSADEVMKICRKSYSDGYIHGQDNIAIALEKESIEALEHFVRSIGESGYASPYDNRTKLVYRLLEQLKQIVK